MLKVAIRLLAKEESDTSDLRADLAEVDARISAAAGRRDEGRPERMVDLKYQDAPTRHGTAGWLVTVKLPPRFHTGDVAQDARALDPEADAQVLGDIAHPGWRHRVWRRPLTSARRWSSRTISVACRADGSSSTRRTRALTSFARPGRRPGSRLRGTDATTDARFAVWVF